MNVVLYEIIKGVDAGLSSAKDGLEILFEVFDGDQEALAKEMRSILASKLWRSLSFEQSDSLVR